MLSLGTRSWNGLAALALVLGWEHLAFAGGLDDTVFMKGGGRVRGVIVEESPTAGVRLKTADGTIRTIPASEVDHVAYGGPPAATPTPLAPAPSPPPGYPPQPEYVIAPPVGQSGALHVETSEPATVSVGGGDYGKAPLDVPALAAGRQKVVVHFEAGGDASRVVTVRPGETTPVLFPPRTDVGGRGIHFGIGAEALLWFHPGSPVDLGGRAFGRMNIGISPVVDLRLDVAVGALRGSESVGFEAVTVTFVPVSTRADIQFNVTERYSLGAGVDLGFVYAIVSIPQLGDAQTASGSAVSGMVGFHASPGTLRFGDKKQFLVSAQEGLVKLTASGGAAVFEQTLTFAYLFLTSKGP